MHARVRSFVNCMLSEFRQLHAFSRSSYRVKLLLQLPKRVPAPSFSTGLALSSMDSQRRQGTQGTR
jgi:hypothetical protein